MINTKRSSSSDGQPPGKKRPRMDRDLDSEFVASSQEDLDLKLLKVQNRRLAESRELKEREKNELKSQLEQLQMKHSDDQLKIYLVNRFWNQLNEDLRIVLQRFEDQHEETTGKDEPTSASSPVVNAGDPASPDTGDESSNHASDRVNKERIIANVGSGDLVRSFVNCDKEELEEQMHKQAEISTHFVSKLMQTFDRIWQRNEKVMLALKGIPIEEEDDVEEIDDEDDEDDEPLVSENGEILRVRGQKKKQGKKKSSIDLDLVGKLDHLVKQRNEELTLENKRLNRLLAKQREKNTKISNRFADMENSIEMRETQVDELKNRIDDLEFELSKARTREQRNEATICNLRDKLDKLHEAGISAAAAQAASTLAANDSKAIEGGAGDLELLGLSTGRVDDLKRELEEQRELAAGRLLELEQLNDKHKETLRLVEKYKMDLQCIPVTVIHETAEYKALQSHFSILYNEANHLKTQLEDTKTQLLTAKSVHMTQIEQMEREELTKQKELRAELMNSDDKQAHTLKELQMLRLEFEQRLAANEQSAPLKSEIQKLYKSHQHHQDLIESEINRRKKKLAEAQAEIVRLRRLLEGNAIKPCCGLGGINEAAIAVTSTCSPQCCLSVGSGDAGSSLSLLDEKHSDSSNDGTLVIKEEEDTKKKATEAVTSIKNEDDSSLCEAPADEQQQQQSQGPGAKMFERLKEELKELKIKLKNALETNKELKVILDQYKSENKEKRDKVMMMAELRKLKGDNEELRSQNKRLLEAERRGDKKRLTDEEYARKISKFEDVIAQLQKDVASHKHEEDIMLREMEVTGQAFEDMQEQNQRLLQQLKEKDDANFKLMSERIKANQIQNLLREKEEMLVEQIKSISSQLEIRNGITRKLEEKERLLQTTLATFEKESNVRNQTVEFYKRKAVEAAQSAADLKLHLDKYLAQVKDSQSIVADKTSSWQHEAFKNKRLHEEVLIYKRKYERAKKFELATTADEVLQEEIRELKEELTCPSCKTKRKDAVLNKCFHVFCYDCLKTRYETRQRKCPKCNQSFSSNDFHRLYLA